MKTRFRLVALTLVALSMLATNACTSETASERADLHDQVMATIARFKQVDPGMAHYFESAYGYAVFPTVAKGGLVVGGAHGEGEAFEQGKKIGRVELTQATVGAQIGGQGYSEVIFFENKAAFLDFADGQYALAAQVSAVAAKAGASDDADYADGVLVFTHSKGGLMAEASVGGQNFKIHKK